MTRLRADALLITLFALLASRDAAGAAAHPTLPTSAPVLARTDASLIPPFSRRYRTSCATCHVTPGKLNIQGEVFRQNGYRFTDNDARLRHDQPVPLGAEPWKELWPQAIWPGEIPGALPLSLYLVNEIRIGRTADAHTRARFVFPAAVALQSATTLGDGVAAFAEVVWRSGSGVQVGEVKAMLHDPLPFLPQRALNIWLGALRPHLLTLGDLSLDRAARQPFLWQRLTLGDWPLHRAGADSAIAAAPFRLSAIRPAIELNGLARGRFYYAIGLVQPASVRGEDDAATDLYVKLRVKLRGLAYDGGMAAVESDSWGGQLLDHGVTLEHFTYVGESALAGGGADEHRSFGLAARIVEGRADIGVGHVWGRHSDPWGVAGLGARHSSVYARAEYLLVPWVIASLKADRTRFRTTGAGALSVISEPLERARVLPGVVLLLRHNVRAIAEGELYLRDRPRSGPSGASAHTAWLRLDVAF